MSLDNIQLSKYAIQSLYSKSLVESTQTQPVKEISSKPDSLGENRKNILFLVNNSENKFLADDEMDLLFNLITACKLSMADIALVNYHTNRSNYKVLTSHFNPKKIFVFGVTTSELDLPFTIPFFQIQPYNQQLYVAGPPLKDFLNNVGLKKELWACLKKIFYTENK
ncbi:MAG: hypothetical protein ABI237_17315 [Ginsengibacter sp.]